MDFIKTKETTIQSAETPEPTFFDSDCDPFHENYRGNRYHLRKETIPQLQILQLKDSQ